MKHSKRLALLAPVPEEHLKSGLEKCAEVGHVVFGSRAFEVFHKLETLREGNEVTAYLYASHSGAEGLVTWRGTYLGYSNSLNGRHKSGMRYRPRTTEKYADDNMGHWALFWEIKELRQLAEDEALLVSEFRGYTTGHPYIRRFRPEGPLLVVDPTAK